MSGFEMDYRVFIVASFILLGSVAQAADCNPLVQVSNGAGTEVRTDGRHLRSLTPQYFGFNLEVVEFQNSLFDTRGQNVIPAVLDYLKRFPGAVYRYPGGTVANHFDWEKSIGDVIARPPQKIVSWQSARSVQFGPDEYLNFIKQVDGKAWYVVNLFGSFSQEANPTTVAASNAKLAAYLESKRATGSPKVFRWELGNELDRGSYKWHPSKYVDYAKRTLVAIRDKYEGPEFVGMAQDWAQTGPTLIGANYNNVLAKSLRPDVREYAVHPYYDGAPWGPPMPRAVQQVCKNLASLLEELPTATVWATEHGKTPLGTPDDPNWKVNWPQTADLGAAISTADMMITLAKNPSVNGAFVHSLHGTSGPWPMFHKQVDGSMRPSAVYWALVILRETMLDQVLDTKVITTNRMTRGVGHDINGSLMSASAGSQWSAWLINRSNEQSVTKLSIPALAGKRVVLKTALLTGNNLSRSNYSSPFDVFPIRKEILVDIDSNGQLSLDLPEFSVEAVHISVAKGP